MAKMQSLARIDLEASDADRISLAQLDPARFTAAPFERSPGSRALKRLFDLVAATIFLIATAPISLLPGRAAGRRFAVHPPPHGAPRVRARWHRVRPV
jgi:hypothetical protein